MRRSRQYSKRQWRLYMRDWRRRNPERAREHSRTFYRMHREQELARGKKWRDKNHKKTAAMKRAWVKKNPEKQKAMYDKWKNRIKLETLTAYSKTPKPSCACCHEKNIGFLTLDHMNGGGGKEYAKLQAEGKWFYAELRKQGFPRKDELQVLCANCNLGRSWNKGMCPHKAKKREE